MASARRRAVALGSGCHAAELDPVRGEISSPATEGRIDGPRSAKAPAAQGPFRPGHRYGRWVTVLSWRSLWDVPAGRVSGGHEPRVGRAFALPPAAREGRVCASEGRRRACRPARVWCAVPAPAFGDRRARPGPPGVGTLERTARETQERQWNVRLVPAQYIRKSTTTGFNLLNHRLQLDLKNKL